jgi:DNA-binding NarL/FixJ family response regulator
MSVAGMREPMTVAVKADDPVAGADAARLLAAAGIRVAARGRLVVLLPARGLSARLEHIREVVKRPTTELVVAALPAGAGGSAMRRALRAGVHGIVFDEHLAESLVPTVQAVLSGQLAVPAALRRQLAPQALSHREKQILSLVVAGYTNRQIADELFVAESTVKTHLSSAFAKLDARSRAEAAALILDPEEGYGPSILGLAGAVTRDAA